MEMCSFLGHPVELEMLAKMKRGKTAGRDRLTVQYLTQSSDTVVIIEAH